MTTERKKMWGVFYSDGEANSFWLFEDHAEKHCQLQGLHHVRPVTLSWTAPKRKGK